MDLIENGIEAQKRREAESFELAERFRTETDQKKAKLLGDQLGRMFSAADAEDPTLR